jgi:lysozyme
MDIEEQLARDEGKVLHPYKDTKGYWTIGIGHLLGANIPQQFANGIDESTCDSLFAADLHHVWDLLDIYIPWWSTIDGQSGPRGNVLVNMGFNLGVQGLSEFHGFLGLMKAHNWAAAAADLANTAVFKQLPERYGRLQRQILIGEWV